MQDHHRTAQKDKEISIKQIVEDERRIIESRFKKDLQKAREENQTHLKKLFDESNSVKNKNEQLQRVLVDKENDLLKNIEKVTQLEANHKQKCEDYEVMNAKLIALESYTSELQSKYDKLVQAELEKTQALNELLNNDLTQKVVEYKN